MNGAGLVWLLLPRLIGHIMCAVSLVLCHRSILILRLFCVQGWLELDRDLSQRARASGLPNAHAVVGLGRSPAAEATAG
jgi:hypothetical protein